MPEKNTRAHMDRVHEEFKTESRSRAAAITANQLYIKELEEEIVKTRAEIAELEAGPVTVQPFAEMTIQEQKLHCNRRHLFYQDGLRPTTENHAREHAARANDPDPVHIHRAEDSDDE